MVKMKLTLMEKNKTLDSVDIEISSEKSHSEIVKHMRNLKLRNHALGNKKVKILKPTGKFIDITNLLVILLKIFIKM